MKKIIAIFFLGLIALVSCDEPALEKPKNLVKKNKMIDMLVDVHLAEATFKHRRHLDSLIIKSSSDNFYYSILEKYQVADSVFEKSFVYYASMPKDFEKMYRQVMNKLNEREQEHSGRKNDLLEFETE